MSGLYTVLEVFERITDLLEDPELAPRQHRVIDPQGDLAGHLQAESFLASLSIEKALRQWSSTGRLPPLAAMESFYLHQRIGLARLWLSDPEWFAKRAAPGCSPTPPDSASAKQILIWLLTDIWRDFGRPFLAANADALSSDTHPPKSADPPAE